MIAAQESKYAGDPPFFILEEVKKRDPLTGKEIERSDVEIHLRHFYIIGQKPFFVFESKRLNVPYAAGVEASYTAAAGAYHDQMILVAGHECSVTHKSTIMRIPR